jgi:hypothetical protein
LLTKLRKTLLECGPFSGYSTLLAVFTDERIAPWRFQVSDGNNPAERVDGFVRDFLDKKNNKKQSVLVLFLQVLHDRAIEQDECYQRLDDLAVEVAATMDAGLPPLARNNLWRASALQAGQALPAELAGFASLEQAAGRGLTATLPPELPAQVFAERLESLKKQQADWLRSDFLAKGAQAAWSVGRVELQGERIGTAFLVTQELVLTNAHVADAMLELAQGGVRFTVAADEQVRWRYFSEKVAYSPPKELDFALLRLKQPHDAAPLILSSETPYVNQHANILQHPNGGEMQVALRNNEIVQVSAKRLFYLADTEGGSSGSPVFDDNWTVIALHRAGIVDHANQPVKHANQGVPITAIEPEIRQHL